MNDVITHKEFSLKKTVLRILLYFVAIDVCIFKIGRASCRERV